MSKALLLVDVINEFFAPDGANYCPSYEQVLAAIQRLVTAARRRGVVVIHARESHRPGPDFEWNKLPRHCMIGSWETLPPPGLDVREDDPVVFKRRYSAFFATDLDLLLRERSVRTLVVAGVKTNVCVRATVQDAFALGYRVVLPREATGSNRPHLHAAALEDVDRYLGTVVSLREAEQTLEVDE